MFLNFIFIITGILLSLSFIFILSLLIIINKMINIHVDFNESYNSEDYEIEVEHFFLKTSDGLKISAFLSETQEIKKNGYIICLSGMFDPPATGFYSHAKFFNKKGYTTLMIDMRAHGDSEGNTISLGYKEYKDVKAAVDYIKKEHNKKLPVILMGFSMGATAVINSLSKVDNIDGFISLSAFSSVEDVYMERLGIKLPSIIYKIVTFFLKLTLCIKFRENCYKLKPSESIKFSGERPGLLIHSTKDREVPFDNFKRIKENSPEHINSYVVEGDMHSIVEDFFNIEKYNEYCDLLSKFLVRFEN